MSILRTVLKFIIWTVIAVYLLTILIFRIPSIQQYAGDRVAAALSHKLGTMVRIEAVNPGWLNRVVIDGVRMDDQAGKPLLTANRLSIRINLFPLITSDRIDISTAQIFGAKLRLYQERPDSKTNFQFVLDSLASKEPKSDSHLDLRLGSLIMRRSTVCFDRKWMPRKQGQLDVNHIKAENISSHLLIHTLTNDSLSVTAKNIALREQSGLDIRRLAFQLECGRTHSRLERLTLQLPDTRLQLADLRADYRMEHGKINLSTLHYRGEIKPSEIAPHDLCALLPSLNAFAGTVTLQSRFSGEQDNVHIRHLSIASTTGDMAVDCNGRVEHLTKKPRWQAHVNTMLLSAKTVHFISENLKGNSINIPEPLVRMGAIRLHGSAEGTALEQVRVQQQIHTDIGNLQLHFAKEADQSFQSTVKTDGIDLQRLLDNSHFGTATADIAISGSLDSLHPSATVKGTVGQFVYNDYPYRNINMDGQYQAGLISGNLSINDPNIGLVLSGNSQTDGSNRNIQVRASLLNFSPKAVNLSDKWGEARFFADVESDISGSRADNATGHISIRNFSMISPTDSYELDELRIESGYEASTHFVRLDSDFAQAEITGTFDFKALKGGLTDFLDSHLPTLSGLPTMAKNDFALRLTMTKSDWLQRVLRIPLAIRQPVTIDGFVQGNTGTVSLTARAPEFYYNGNSYRDGYASISTPGDSLACQTGVVKVMDNEDQMDINITATARDNRLNTTLHWDNHKAEKTMAGTLNATTMFHKTEDGQQAANIRVNPSHINIHNTKWNVEPSTIRYAPNHVDIRHFTIRHDDQHLIVDGTASTLNTDSIHVALNDLDIEYILELVNFHAVDFNGQATGLVQASAVFSNKPKASAQLTVDDFKFEHGRMGVLHAAAEWNDQQQQIDIHAIADDGQHPDGRPSKTYIDGYVSPVKSFIDLDIRAQHTRTDFMQSFTKSFISRLDGTAQGTVRLSGPLSTINIAGQLVVNGEADIRPTGCTYWLRNDTITLVPDEIVFDSCPIYDKNGQQGIVTGGIHHQHLTHLTYDIFVDAQRLLAYDFTDFGDETFYGTVYGTGRVGLHGRPDETTIDLEITPEQGSSFTYNVAQPDAIGNQEFIRWGNGNDTAMERTDKTDRTDKTERKKQNDSPLEDRSDMRINFLINCTPKATLRLLMDSQTDDYITLNGNGVLRATWFNKGGFQMFGTYLVEHGTYGVTIQEIIKKDFTFQPGGTIIFAGDPYEATINLQAMHTVNGVSLSDLNVGKSFSNTVKVNCLMNITGQPASPIIDFDFDMPNVNTDEKQMVRSIINGQEEMNQQVLYLLGIGRFYPQGANNAETSGTQQSQTALAMQSLLSGTLSSQLNTLLKSVIKSNDWSFGANISTGDEGWNNAEYEGMVSGRMFNNRLLLNGQFGYRDKANTANTTFIGDFDVRYLLVPNGNLSLKVYNQTNDRYFTKSSLNTQGLGLILKKDFSDLRDLFGIRKRKNKEKDK